MREALGMTTRQMAGRLNVSQPRILQIEKAEYAGTVTLNTLRDAANAMGCDLVYAVVPRKSIPEVLEERADKRARETLKPVLHTMALEAQALTPEASDDLLKQRIRSLLAGRPSRLWDEEAKD
jgi:predicted DNA-binding mobile mystery protein A